MNRRSLYEHARTPVSPTATVTVADSADWNGVVEKAARTVR